MQASILPTFNTQSNGLLKVEILSMGNITANFTLHASSTLTLSKYLLLATEDCPLQLNRSVVDVSSLTPRNALASFAYNLSYKNDLSYHSTCKVIYFIWLLYRAGLLGPLVRKLVDLIALACNCICNGLTRLFGGN
ncbi:hypothetical protein R1flu_014598 [Riccia fluitans]|uniref:Uncharacterized protein n=1 Tax=Riccia fluitans TaxID=41844 RepID=A0ABD1YGN9_9MARC